MAPKTNLLNQVRLNHLEIQVSDRVKAATNVAVRVESVKLKLTEQVVLAALLKLHVGLNWILNWFLLNWPSSQRALQHCLGRHGSIDLR